MKNKRNYTYKDQNVVRAGTTTKVDGTLEISSRTENKFLTLLGKVYTGLDKVFRPREVIETTTTSVDGFPVDEAEETIDVACTSYYVTEGVSKLDPEDKYDAKTGMVIASRKAEAKALKKALADVTPLVKALEDMLDLAKSMEDEADYRMNKINLGLAANKKVKGDA